MTQSFTNSSEVNNTTKKPQSKLGRRGDPRMHRAVAARLADPNLSLMEALQIGGFDFETNGVDDATLKDKDGVTMGQRKNQLSRRLRHAKQQNNHATTTGDSTTTNHTSAQSLPYSSLKRNSSVLSSASGRHGDEEEEEEEDEANRMAKFHPYYHPIFMPQPHASTAAGAVIGTTPSWETGWAAAVTASSNSSKRAAVAPSQDQPPQPSGVAIASLRQTASSVGMTLEQLAMTLHSTPNLTSVLRNSNSNKEDIALHLYRNENQSLYKRCMHLAGYNTQETLDHHSSFLSFCTKAWQAEGRRLEQVHATSTSTSSPPAQEEEHHHHEKHESTTDDGGGCKDHSCERGRHVHRLEGKCGHKAIIHQPDNGPAHVDFLVNGKVECYMGIKPVSGSSGYWRSSFKCTHQDCNSSLGSPENSAEVNRVDPKLFDLNDIDFDGKEWNSNLSDTTSQIDETLLGLIRLGDQSDD